MSADRLRAMIARTPGSITAEFNGASTPGLLDFEGSAWGPEGFAQIAAEEAVLTYVFPDLPGLEPGSLVVAGGAYFRVSRGPRRRGDGVEGVAILQEAAP